MLRLAQTLLHAPPASEHAAVCLALSEGKMCVQVAVCTPGRLIDLLKMKACSMQRATYLALDEADRMFEMGFEAQVSFHKEVECLPKQNQT